MIEHSIQEQVTKYNDLIQIANDGKDGYENAAENVDDPEMKKMFMDFSRERAGYVRELQQQVKLLNSDPEDDGSTSATLHRAWMDVKSTFTGGDKDAIINASITGEESALKEYKSILDESDITSEARNVIARQYAGIKQALETIKTYRD